MDGIIGENDSRLQQRHLELHTNEYFETQNYTGVVDQQNQTEPDIRKTSTKP
jgi:hypothetical protein